MGSSWHRNLLLVRRNWMNTTRDDTWPWLERTSLQVVGLANADDYHKRMWKQQLVEEMDKLCYEVVCSCDGCVIFRDDISDQCNNPGRRVEHMMDGVVKILDLMSEWNYRRITSTGVMNNDQSTTTTWVVSNPN